MGGGRMTVLSVLDSAGRRRSPATMPGYHAGRPPRNKGIRYPADPPTVEEIVAVMRHAGDRVHGRRLRDWTKLKSVPAGLADGLDNGVDRAGFGLKKNLYPNVEFAVDRTKIQQRVDGSCPAGQAVKS